MIFISLFIAIFGLLIHAGRDDGTTARDVALARCFFGSVFWLKNVVIREVLMVLKS
jgi:hypothetical protein